MNNLVLEITVDISVCITDTRQWCNLLGSHFCSEFVQHPVLHQDALASAALMCFCVCFFQRLQLLLLNPLKELSNINHPDIRLKQLECVLQILQSQGDSLGPGWPLVLGVMGAIRNDQG